MDVHGDPIEVKQVASGTFNDTSYTDATKGAPPKDVMNKLQQQLERVQRDIQEKQRQATQQRPAPRHSGSRFRQDHRRQADSNRYQQGGGMSTLRSYHGPGIRPQGFEPGSKVHRAQAVYPRPQHQAWPGARLAARIPGGRQSWGYRDRLPTPGRSQRFSQPRPNTGPDNTKLQWNASRGLLPTPGDLHSHGFSMKAGNCGGDHLVRSREEESDVSSAVVSPGLTYEKFRETEYIPQNEEKPEAVQDISRNQDVDMIEEMKNSDGKFEPTTISSEPKGDQNKEKMGPLMNDLCKPWQENEPNIPGECFSKCMAADEVFFGRADICAATESNKSPPTRKDRSSSGPKTPPGMRCDSPFWLNSPRDLGMSVQNTLLAGLKLRVAKTAPRSVTVTDGDRIASTNKGIPSTAALVQGDEEEAEMATKAPKQPGLKSEDKRDLKRKASEAGNQTPTKILQRSTKTNIEAVNIIRSDKDEDCDILIKQTSKTGSGESTLWRTDSDALFKSPFLYSPYQGFKTTSVGHHQASTNATTLFGSGDTECTRCHKRFRWPHLLVCCHRFCFPCLVDMFDHDKKRIQCPYCRSITKTDDSLTSLMLDLQKCREMAQAQISPFSCTLCFNGHASLMCKTCPGYLCSECQTEHKNQADFSSHDLVQVGKVGYNENGELHPLCKDHHGMLLSKFCVSCKVMVCEMCHAAGQHTGHEVCDLISGRNFAEKRFREMNRGLSELIEHCQKKLQNFNLSKQRVEAQVKLVRNNIHKSCNQLIEDIEAYEKKSKKMAGRAHDAGMKHIMELRKEAGRYDGDRNTFELFVKRHIYDSRPRELTSVVPLVSRAFSRLASYYTGANIVDPDFSVDLTFDPIYPDFNDAVSRIFSEVQFSHNVTMEALLSSPLGERAIQEAALPHPYDLACPPSASALTQESTTLNAHPAGSENDVLKNFIRRTTPSKYIFGKFGRGQYEFAEPSGVCYLDDGSLAICDAKNHCVVVYNEDRSYAKTIGQPKDLPPLSSNAMPTEDEQHLLRMSGVLYFPFRLAQCPVSRDLVIVERPPRTDIQVFRLDGSFVRRFGHDCLRYPRGVAVDEQGQVLVIESRTMKVFIFSPEGVKRHAFYLSMHLEFPNDIAARAGSIFVSDNRTHCVHVYNYNLEWQRQIGDESLTYFPIGVALDHQGHVVVADNHNTFNISVFLLDGSLVTGFKSEYKHANCYSMAVHPSKTELAVTTKDCRVVIFDYMCGSIAH